MPLQQQTKSVPLFGGIDTKMDPKYVAADKLLTAENVQFFGVNRARKRYGQTVLPKNIVNQADLITVGKAIGSFNDELLVYDGANLYAYSQGQEQWVDRGAFTEVSVSRTPIVRSGGSVSGIASVTAGSAEFYAWEDSRGGVYYCIRDADSGTMLIAPTLVSGGTVQPQLVAAGTGVYLFYRDGVFVQCAVFNSDLPEAGITATYALTGLVDANGRYAVASTDTRIMLCVCTSATVWTTYIYDTSLTALATDTAAITSTLGQPAALAYSTDGTQACLVVINQSAVTANPYFINVSTGAETASSTTLSALATRVGVVGTTANLFRVYAAVTSTATQPRIEAATIDALGVAAVASVSTTYGLTLASQPGLFSGGAYVVAASPSTNLAGDTSQQAAFYLLDGTGAVVQRFSGDTASSEGTVLPRLQLDDSTLFVGLSEKTVLRADANGTVYTATGLSAMYFTFPTASNFKVVSYGDTALITCGNVYTYDGTNIVESGFWEWPDGLSAVAAAGGNLNAGTYNYCVTYEWEDAAGNTHYSAPSYPLAVTTALNDKVTLTIPYTTLTRKTGVTVAVYRTATAPGDSSTTATGLGPWFKIRAVDNVATGTASFTFEDTASDASLQGNQFLYAPPDGAGELDNFAPPPFSFMVATKTRVFGFAQDDPTALWYSKPFNLGRPAEFSPLQIIRVETAGGLPTALSHIDAQAVIFKAQRIYYLPGDGPNAGGGGALFGAPQLISSTSGCTSDPSVLSMHDGVFFKSQLGLQLLGRGLSVDTQIGLPVQGFNSLTLTGAVACPDQNQLRWTSSNGTALVYDYVTGRWCTYTGYASVGYAPWDGTYARLRSDGAVFYEDQTTYLDAGSAVRMTVETAWLKPATMAQGYAAVWYAQILGTFTDAHTLTVETSYDYTDTIYQSNVWTTSGNINTSTFGSSATFGSDAFFGGNVAQPSTNYQLRVALQRQTCEAVKFKIYDSSITGASCDLNEITLQLGVIGGLNRTTPGRQV